MNQKPGIKLDLRSHIRHARVLQVLRSDPYFERYLKNGRKARVHLRYRASAPIVYPAVVATVTAWLAERDIDAHRCDKAIVIAAGIRAVDPYRAADSH